MGYTYFPPFPSSSNRRIKPVFTFLSRVFKKNRNGKVGSINRIAAIKGKSATEKPGESDMMAINNDQIQAMLAQIRSTGAQITPPASQVKNVATPLTGETAQTKEPGKIDFADALRATLDNVNNLQVQSEHLGQQFSLGNDDVQLSDVMIAMSKASIALQTTVQARNRFVSAYQEIMGMQI